MRAPKVLVLVHLGLLLAAAGLASNAPDGASGSMADSGAERRVTLSPQELERAGVRTAVVDAQKIAARQRVVGRIVRSPGSTITVTSRLEARIEAVLVAPGDTVRAGQALLRGHSHQLHDLHGELLSAREALRLAETRLEAGRRLWQVDGISRLDLEHREQQVLEARIRRDRSRAELHALDLDDQEIDALLAGGGLQGEVGLQGAYTYKAPVAGTVLEVKAQEHGWVRGFEPLLVLGDPERLELELQLPPEAAARVDAGDTVRVHAVGRSGETVEARVLGRVPQVDPTTRALIVRARLIDSAASRAASLVAGTFVEGWVESARPARALPAVPASAVIRLGRTDVVFVDHGSGVFGVRPVVLGQRFGEPAMIEVEAGLEVDEEVAVAGVFLLKSAVLQAEG